MPLRSVLRRAAAAALLLASVPACSTTRTLAPPRPGAAPTGSVDVVLTDGRRLQLTGVTSTADSLVGETGRPPGRRAVALRDVARVERRAISAGRTAALAAAIALGVAVVGAVILLMQAYSPIA